jgi:hypothetical protein
VLSLASCSMSRRTVLLVTAVVLLLVCGLMAWKVRHDWNQCPPGPWARPAARLLHHDGDRQVLCDQS